MYQKTIVSCDIQSELPNRMTALSSDILLTKLPQIKHMHDAINNAMDLLTLDEKMIK